MLQAYLSGLPLFTAYLLVAAAVTALFGAAYVAFTPYNEIRLIRAGNRAAALAFVGALLGFALPLSTAMRFNGNMAGFLVWAAIAAAVQFAAFTLARLVAPGAPARIKEDDLASGIWIGGVAVVLGILNAASMTP